MRRSRCVAGWQSELFAFAMPIGRAVRELVTRLKTLFVVFVNTIQLHSRLSYHRQQITRFVNKMPALYLDSSDWLNMLRVSQTHPCATYNKDTSKLVLWFDSPHVGRIVLAVARGSVRNWSPEAACRFLSLAGLSWTVHLSDGLDLYPPSSVSAPSSDSAP